jgi:hypothetical protein
VSFKFHEFSDDEGVDLDNNLFAHLINEVSKLDLEEVDLDTKNFDFIISTKNPKKSIKGCKPSRGKRKTKVSK